MRIAIRRIGKQIGALFLALLVGISFPLLIWTTMVIAFQQLYVEWRAIRAGTFSWQSRL